MLRTVRQGVGEGRGSAPAGVRPEKEGGGMSRGAPGAGKRAKKRAGEKKGAKTPPEKATPQTRKERAAGRWRKKPRAGGRLNITRLAEAIKVDRKTVSKWLAEPGAPKPDQHKRFDVAAADAWIKAQSPKIGASEEVKRLREWILKMEAEDMDLTLRQRRGELVKKSEIEPAITSFTSALVEHMRAKFEFELPGKYEGKTTEERAALNAQAIDFVLTQLKAGTAPLTK